MPPSPQRPPDDRRSGALSLRRKRCCCRVGAKTPAVRLLLIAPFLTCCIVPARGRHLWHFTVLMTINLVSHHRLGFANSPNPIPKSQPAPWKGLNNLLSYCPDTKGAFANSKRSVESLGTGQFFEMFPGRISVERFGKMHWPRGVSHRFAPLHLVTAIRLKSIYEENAIASLSFHPKR
jgi:hypothetical protein